MNLKLIGESTAAMKKTPLFYEPLQNRNGLLTGREWVGGEAVACSAVNINAGAASVTPVRGLPRSGNIKQSSLEEADVIDSQRRAKGRKEIQRHKLDDR